MLPLPSCMHVDPTCSFLTDEQAMADGSWMSDGCSLVSTASSSNVTVCQCYHLTSFALLMSPTGESVSTHTHTRTRTRTRTRTHTHTHTHTYTHIATVHCVFILSLSLSSYAACKSSTADSVQGGTLHFHHLSNHHYWTAIWAKVSVDYK